MYEHKAKNPNPTYQIVKIRLLVICVYLFAGKLTKTVANNAFL